MVELEALVLGVSVVGTILAYALRNEHRLTKLETKVDSITIHLRMTTPHNPDSKQCPMCRD